MSATDILWGQIVVFFAIVIITMWRREVGGLEMGILALRVPDALSGISVAAG